MEKKDNMNNSNYLVNLFAEFLLNKLGLNSDTVIKIIYLENFIVVKGKTNIKEPLNLIELKDEFLNTFSDKDFDKKLSHTIDLIEYDCKIKPVEKISQIFYNSENCALTQKKINELSNKKDLVEIFYSLNHVSNDSSISISKFPFGYSLNQGRLLYYYAKNIIYSIPTNYFFNSLSLTLSTKKNIEENLRIFNLETEEEDLTLKSSILDSFDFEMGWIENEIKKVDWSFEVNHPLNDLDFLKTKNSDFIII